MFYVSLQFVPFLIINIPLSEYFREFLQLQI